jgi:hypothetical protein
VPTFEVTVLRTERITFAVDAANAAEAEDTYLGGDEIASRTTDITVESVQEAAFDAR